jgi:Ca2+-binding EF-hand superfamily protein
MNEAFLVFSKGQEDGSISPEDLVFMMNKFEYQISLDEAKDVIDSADFSGDGCLNFEEFSHLMMGRH